MLVFVQLGNPGRRGISVHVAPTAQLDACEQERMSRGNADATSQPASGSNLVARSVRSAEASESCETTEPHCA
eukprot:3862090-Prymnesium_polylepis.1